MQGAEPPKPAGCGYGQYLADQIPPCADLPARRFLRAGARYSYLGGSPAPLATGGTVMHTPLVLFRWCFSIQNVRRDV